MVTLPERCAQAWVWSLAECGTHLEHRLGLQRQIPRFVDGGGHGDSNRAQRSLSGVLAWLGRITDGLIEVAGHPFQPPPEDMPTTNMR
ncbi:hypothetical protein ACWEO2_44035 [Nocardia sp. NPDC004278]